MKKKWIRAVVLGLVFLLSLFIVQWFFGEFLLSPYSRNWFFGTESWYFGSDPNSPKRYAFRDEYGSLSHLLVGLSIAAIYSVLSTRLGLGFGNWMRRVQR